MNINKTADYTVVKPDNETIVSFLKSLQSDISNYKGNHLIIDFSENSDTKINELVLFLELSTQHRENGTSFVLISNGIDIDEIPDELNVVPTFEEAIDILEMDAIERELGF